MRHEKAHLLPLVVGTTLGLLTLAAVLVVVGIFNETLGWDLFGPRLEAALWGVFSSCLALAAIGVAMTLVAGTRSIVRSFERLERGVTGRPAVPELAPRRTLRYTFTLAAGLAILVAALSATDRAILHHRSSVFKRLASEQALRFGDRLQPLAQILPRGFGPRDMERIDLALRSLLNLPFVNRVIVYRLDPNDAGAFLYYEALPSPEAGRQGHRTAADPSAAG